MKSDRCPQVELHHKTPNPPPHRPGRDFLKRWFVANSLVGGFLALCWLLLRSGPRPSRFAYPCQQAAMSVATFAFGVPLVSALVAARRRIAAGLRTPAGTALAAGGLLLTGGVWSYLASADASRRPLLDPPPDYRAQVFQVTDCPQDPAGEMFAGLNGLLALMGREGLKFYDSANQSPVAGPDGIIAADDVVVIKINYQWPERGGTNTELLRGLIRCIVDHPDSFTGEIVVCENTQGESSEGFDRPNNNAQDYGLSPLDVVLGFQSQGYTVSHYIWTDVRHRAVSEYIAGNYSDGYVVGPYNAQVQGRVSYPKFQTDAGTYISLRYGIWDPGSGTYNREGLKFINVPVLKSHSASYGATACVKNYMGVVTNLLSTNSHNGIEYGILGALNGEIQLADLNILDCIWINPNPYSGPWTPYGTARRKDILVASVDPVAADIWAVKNILIPGFIENGYSPPWPYPSADPDDPDSSFRVYLDNSMDQILAAGYEVTNDLDQIDVFSMSWRLEAPVPEDSLGTTCSEDADCENAATCIEGVCYAPKSRYLSVCASPCNAAYPSARRVSVEVGASTIQMGWLDAPTMDPVSGIRTSRVRDYPVYSYADFPGEWPDIVHVTGCKIVPGWTYWVQNILLGQSTANQSAYSDPLVVPTAAVWGDVVGQCPENECTPPQGDPYTQPDIDDVLALVSAFIGVDNAPLTWLDVDPVADFGYPEGLISIGDVLAVVKAFVGEPYPGPGPFGCQ